MALGDDPFALTPCLTDGYHPTELALLRQIADLSSHIEAVSAAGLGWLVLRLWPDPPDAGERSRPDDGAVL